MKIEEPTDLLLAVGKIQIAGMFQFLARVSIRMVLNKAKG
jgi:hypothetical protein